MKRGERAHEDPAGSRARFDLERCYSRLPSPFLRTRRKSSWPKPQHAERVGIVRTFTVDCSFPLTRKLENGLQSTAQKKTFPIHFRVLDDPLPYHLTTDGLGRDSSIFNNVVSVKSFLSTTPGPPRSAPFRSPTIGIAAN